jgi:hypothetical protein
MRDPQTDLLKHAATISTGAAVVVVALRSELASGFLVLSIALLFLSLLISVVGMAWKGPFYGLLGEEGATHKEIGFFSVFAYLFFIVGVLVLVGSLVWPVVIQVRLLQHSRRLEGHAQSRLAIHPDCCTERRPRRCPSLRGST